jgi:tRNA pseudouridine38-40 synthase
MNKKRYFLQLSYKGTNFFGWQIQPDHPTIQSELERVLTALHKNEKTEIVGCGRTDTGVHASKYYAHFDSHLVEDIEQWRYKMNTMLPKDISIHEIIPVSSEAHARFDADARTYHYFIHTEKDSFIHDISWYYKPDLDIEKMNNACLLLLDHEDFECFSKVKTEVNHFRCDIKQALWVRSDKGLIFSITANRFLRNMVRAIVGTMLEIGLNKMNEDEFKKVLMSGDRSQAGQSVPARGLFLADIAYPYISKTQG